METQMPDLHLDLSVAIFLSSLVATFAAAYLGRWHSPRTESAALSQQKLNRWLIGLSAGAAANSGFVVTGAVGLGYMFGAQWILLPLAWLAGDIVFWWLFPHRINRAGAEAKAATLTGVLIQDLPALSRSLLEWIVAVVVLLCLSGYVAAQWIAGQKFLHGAFGFADITSLLAFAAVIVTYTAVGGFRGSVYTDSLQAIIRMAATAIAVFGVVIVARNTDSFWSTLNAAGPDFFSLFPHHSPLLALGFILGFAAASLGFGLGQPQLVTRYLAGESPEETRKAWWIYIGFVQSTWIAMTVFGMILRGVMPNIADPETGLSVFFRTEMGPALTGIIVADIFATISATSNSLLVAMAQTVKFDILPRAVRDRLPLWPITAVLGLITMAISLSITASVVSLALGSVSLMGAALAPAMMIRVARWRCTGSSLILAIISGLAVAAVWRQTGLSAIVNEAAPGILAGLTVNYIVARISTLLEVLGRSG